MTIPTIAEIRDQILADYESKTGATAPLLPKAAIRVIATALAAALNLLYRFGSWLYDQIFTVSMDETALVRRGQEYRITRTPAQNWRGTATITGTDTTVVPAGTIWVGGDYVYEQQAAVTISGSTTITLESLEAGDAVTPTIGDTLELSTPQTGVDREATVASTTQSGEDKEALEDYRARILFRQRNQPQGGAIPDWIAWTLEVAGIAEATIERASAGFINIYPITDDADPADRIPDSSKISEVQAYVTDQERAPIRAAAVTTIAPTELDFDVDIADLSPNDSATQAAIEDAIEAYLYARRPDQYDDVSDSIGTVSQSDVTAVARDAGAKVATVDLKNAGGSSITSYELDKSELAKLRTLSWV